MSLTTCISKIKKSGVAFNAVDKKAVHDLSRKYRADGKSHNDAAIQAVEDQIKAVQALIVEAQKPVAKAVDDVLAAPTESDALRMGLGDFTVNSGETLIAMPGGTWVLLDGRRASYENGQFNLAFSWGNGKWSAGDTSKTPGEAYQSALKTWTSRGNDAADFKPANKGAFLSGVQGPDLLTAPTRANVIANQDRKEDAAALDDKAQIDREAAGQTLTKQTAPEQRKDTSGDMFGEDKAKLEAEKREADAVAKNEASKDPNQGGMFDEPTDEIGDFGPILTQFKGDARGAIKALTELQNGEAVAALHHPAVGDIDLVWGKEGTKEKDYEDGSGLAKISVKHPEVLNDLQSVLDSLVENPEKERKGYKVLENSTHTAVVRLDWDRKSKTWLLTAFENEELNGGSTRASADTLSSEARSQTISSDASVAQPSAESKPADKQAQPAAKIEDSGEVLEGARKLYAKAYAAKMDEGMALDIAAVPLSKSWPEPDYQRMLDDGAEPWAVAFAHAARDEVPTKPIKAWKVKGWVEKVQLLRGFTNKVLTGDGVYEQDNIKSKLDGALKNLGHKVDLYEAAGHERSLKGVNFSVGQYGMYAGKTYDPPKTMWAITELSNSASATWSHGNWGNEIAVADTKAEAIEKYKTWAAAQSEKPATPTKGTVFDIYSYKSRPNEFIVGKRLSTKKSLDLKTFPTAQEAREFKANHQAELESLLEKAKLEPSERGESNAPRVGADHRISADVTTEQFRETFGFRGEQFGASMPQGERQSNLNQAYDALMDLAGVIGVPPKALSLNGELGLAFGARGTGGKSAPMAHYERDTTGAVTPNRVVINLTRKSGAGSLAHEWFHGVDNYFARMRGEQGGMLTDRPYELMNKGVRPEMIEAFKELVKTINQTGIKERSKQLDKKRVKDYWSTGLEMAARSFESYVIAKLQDQNASNDYLANVVPESLYGMQSAYPYPSMGEMPQIRAAFDHFFDVVQTKETDKGVALQEPQSAYNVKRDLNEPTQPDDGKAGAAESASVPTVRGDGSALQRRVAITGMGIAADIKRAGSAALIGRKVTNPAELAELAQIYRDPRYETFRVFFTKDNTVIHATGVSARMPGFTPMLPSDMTMQQYVTMFKDEMQRTGADGYYLLHNHPSGNPTPSSADISITADLNAKVPGMKAHVVINSNKYAVIEADASALISPESRVKVKDFGEDQMLKASKPLAAIGRALNKPDDLVAIGKSMQRPGWITLIGSDSQNRVRVVAEAPSSTLTRSDAYLAGSIRRLMRNSGSTNVFAMGENGDINSKPIQRAVKIGLLRDAMPETGMSLGAAGLAVGPSTNYFNYTQGKAVAEDEADMQFSRTAASSMTIDQARAITDPLTAKWNLDVKVVATPADLPIPAPSDVRGMYMNGKIWIVASNNANRAQILETLGHEAIAHHGLREMLGREDWRKLMGNISLAIKSGNKPLNAISQRVRSEYVDDNGKFNLTAIQEADEIAAKVVEGAIDPATGEFNPGFGFLKSVFAKVAQFLRDIGIDVKFTNLELQGMLVSAMRNLESEARMQGGGQVVVAASRGDVFNSQLLNASGRGSLKGFERFGGDAGDIDLAQRQVSGLLGFAPRFDAELVDTLDDATPAALQRTNGKILINSSIQMSQSAMVELMTEEVLHGIDSLNGTRVLSGSSARLREGGDIFSEAVAIKGEVGTFLAYPLKANFDQNRTAAELFARLGTVYYSNPDLMRRTMPQTYEAYHELFGLEPRTVGTDDFTLRARAWRETRPSASMRGQHGASEQILQRLARRADGKPDSPQLGRLRAAVVRIFQAQPNGTFYGGGLSATDNRDTLTSYTPEEAKKKQLEEEAARKTEAEKPKAPTGRKVTADQVDLFNPQGALFSRTLNEASSLNNPRGLVNATVAHLNDRFTAPGTLNWWQKSVGTQYDLAQRSKPFKRVFDSVQNFINDTSFYATEASDLAPKLVPKLESWKDIVKKPISSDDSKAIAAPIFEGTLNWSREENGELVKSENGTGVVFTNAELKDKFNLTPEQIGLYREFRTATDKSLNNLVVSHMVKLGGADVAPIADQALQARDAAAASDLISKYLVSLAENDEGRSDVLMSTAAKMAELAKKASDLTSKGYAPLSRFGHYTVDVISDGQRAYFGMFESKIEANRMAKKMQENYPQSSIRQGTVSEEEYKLFAGVTPETLELFGEMLGLDSQGSDAKNQVFQEYLKAAKSNRSAMKRLIHRKGIAGFSEDASRVLAGFIYSNARQTSANLHAGETTKATADIPQGQGEVKDAAIKLAMYVQNPQEEAQVLRGLMFAQYIGGSVASAMVNLTQPFTMTLPWLSQYGGIASAAKQMAAATRDALKDKTGDAKLDAALKHAEEEGIVSPQEVHQLQKQASGAGSLKSGDGTTLGDAKAMASNSVSRIMLGWGKLFGVAEQFNRRSTFIAAYRTAVEQGIDNPAQFAEKAISETQGIYNKGNKPAWGRGAIGATLFTFKQFSISYVEMIGRMVNGPQANTASRMAALNAMAILFLVAGAGGLPGADDLDDLISGLLQSMGYNFDSKAKRRAFLVAHIGAGGQRFVEHGLSGLPGVPIDVSGRLGLGNLIPGTGLLTKKNDHTRDVLEFAGPAGDLFKRGFEAGGDLIKGDVGGALNSVAPMAARNVVKAFDMANMGMYRDLKGNKVIDTDMTEALFKGIGFQPSSVKQVQDSTGEMQRMIGLNKMREAEIADKWAQGLFEKNPEKTAEARQEIKDWNADNPDMRIKINYSQIFKRLKAMNQTKAQRIEKTAPVEIRSAVRQELATQ